MVRALLRWFKWTFFFFSFKLQKQACTPHSVVTNILHYLLNSLKLVVIRLGLVEKSCQFFKTETLLISLEPFENWSQEVKKVYNLELECKQLKVKSKLSEKVSSSCHINGAHVSDIQLQLVPLSCSMNTQEPESSCPLGTGYLDSHPNYFP